MSRSADKIEAAVGEIRHAGGVADGFAADVRDYAAVEEAAARASSAGSLDVVVSGAAGNFLAAAAAMSSNAFQTVVGIDLVGTFHAARACHRHMTRPGSSFLAISAPQSRRPMLGQAHVCAAKAGIDMLVKCLALEWGPQGIRANAISPGPIAGTEGMRRLAPDEASERAIKEALPLGRYGEAEEIAAAACFLASDEGAYITGTILDVDGGTMLGGGRLV